MIDSGLTALTVFLCDLCRGRDAADTGNADHRIILAAGEEVEDVAAEQAAYR